MHALDFSRQPFDFVPSLALRPGCHAANASDLATAVLSAAKAEIANGSDVGGSLGQDWYSATYDR